MNQPGVGDMKDYNGGSIRAFRFGLNGQIKFARPWHYSIWVATNSFDADFDEDETDKISAYDYRLDIPLADRMTLSVGKQKEPISLPRLMTLTWNPMQERTAAENALLPSRNIGIAMSGYSQDQNITWAAGVFNDWIEEDVSFGDNSKQYIGRVTWVPAESGDGNSIFHLGAAIRYDDAKQGLRYKAVPEVRDAPFFVDTGQFEANSSNLINLEASWRNGPVWLMFEMTRNHVDTPEYDKLTFDGYHVVGTWALTGEMRPYQRITGVFGALPIARDIDHGGYGALELALRWSRIDLNNKQMKGGEMDVAKAALTWWASSRFNISLNYQYIWNEYYDSNGRASSVVARVAILTR